MEKVKIDSVTLSTKHFVAVCDDGDLMFRLNVPEGGDGICSKSCPQTLDMLIDELINIKVELNSIRPEGWGQHADMEEV